MADSQAPFHAHIYYSAEERAAAAALRERFSRRTDAAADPHILFVGPMRDQGVGPHPTAQYEIHFAERSLAAVAAQIEATGLTALIHPLTDDDLADHTISARWIGEPLDLDLAVLDPPGANKGTARFGKTDF